MSVRSVVAGGLVALAAILPYTRPLPAQEVIDLPAADRPLEADFEEVFRVGVMDGEPWETFGYVHEVAFDANGNLYVFDALSSGGTLPDGRSYSMPSIEDTRVLGFFRTGAWSTPTRPRTSCGSRLRGPTGRPASSGGPCGPDRSRARSGETMRAEAAAGAAPGE